MFKLYHIEWEGNTHFTNYTIFYFCQEIMNENSCHTSWWKWWCIHLIIPVGSSLNNFVCISVLISVVSCKPWTFMWLFCVLSFDYCTGSSREESVLRHSSSSPYIHQTSSITMPKTKSKGYLQYKVFSGYL